MAALLCLLTRNGEAQTIGGHEQPVLMTSYKWVSLTEAQMNVYRQGVLETVSFLMFNNPHDAAHADQFSEWTKCSEQAQLQSWYTADWTLGGKTETTVAAQFLGLAGVICKDSKGKGDGDWRPVWLLKPQEWKGLTLRDRAIYLMAYAETTYEMLKRAGDKSNLAALDRCIGAVGIEGLLSELTQSAIDEKTPLPWSISKVFGTACKGEYQ